MKLKEEIIQQLNTDKLQILDQMKQFNDNNKDEQSTIITNLSHEKEQLQANLTKMQRENLDKEH